MLTLHIVTDSCAHFANPHFVHQHPVTVVPNRLTINGKVYREGVDLSAEEAIRMLSHEPYAPVVRSPSEADFLDVYRRLARQCDGVISIHPSREMYPSWQRARLAAQQMLGHCQIEVIDSRTLSAGLGMLVRTAARAIDRGLEMEDIVREVRGAVDRIYSVYYVETMDYLFQNKLLASSHAILGGMLGAKPFLAVEDGRLVPMEKVKTRVQAVERLVEFAVEFTEIDDAVILQHKPYMSEQTRMLQDRLAVEFPDRHFPYVQYGPSLTALIGLDATGLVVLESETARVDDDFS